MKIILLSLGISLLIVFLGIPVLVCYTITGNIKVKNLKKVYYFLFKD